jgi:DNA-binding winged helix-turn-helix (wHTH) protein
LAQDNWLSSSDCVSGTSYSFGSFKLDADGTLHRGKLPVHLPPKELAALRLLLENSGKVVTAQQLRQALWGDVHVTADSVPKCVSSLRALLEPDDCIQTVYKRGYRFSAELLGAERIPSAPAPRLAILPFATEYNVPEHLGWHVAEETMIGLGKIRPAIATLLARDSVFTLARRGMTAQQAGQTLNADLAVAGAIRALPGQYRLRIELIRIADNTQLWVDDLLVEQEHPEAIEIELARQLVFRLTSATSGLSIAAAAFASSEEPAPRHGEAYALYQRAHFEWQTLQRHRMQDGLQRLLRSTELDPSLVEAWIDLINLCVAQELFGYMSPSSADEIAQRAMAQIPNIEMSAERILPSLGWLEFHIHQDLRAALRLFNLSAHLPHDPWITRCRVMLSLSRHRFGETIEMLHAAIRLDPFSPWLHARLAWALHLNGDAEASIDRIRHAIEIFPDRVGPALYGSLILAYNGEARTAIDLAKDLTHRLPYLDLATAAYAYALAAGGERDEAHFILERLQWLSRERFVMSSCTPAAWVAVGDLDSAMISLRNAEKARCPWFFQMLADPRLKPLAEREEFKGMKRVLTQMETDATFEEPHAITLFES